MKKYITDARQVGQTLCMYVCMYIRLKQLTYRNIDNRDNKRKSKC